MAEQAPVASRGAAERAPAKRAASGAAKARKPSGPSVTELLTQAAAASKERGGVSLAVLKKSLAAAGYDVEKNNSRIKLGLKSLVTKGTLVQTKGTGASGSFKLNKKQAEAKDKAGAAAKKKPGSAGAAKSKKPAAKKPPSAAKRGKKAAAVARGTPRVKVTKPKKAAKSPAKVSKPQAKAKPKAAKGKRLPKK